MGSTIRGRQPDETQRRHNSAADPRSARLVWLRLQEWWPYMCWQCVLFTGCVGWDGESVAGQALRRQRLGLGTSLELGLAERENELQTACAASHGQPLKCAPACCLPHAGHHKDPIPEKRSSTHTTSTRASYPRWRFMPTYKLFGHFSTSLHFLVIMLNTGQIYSQDNDPFRDNLANTAATQNTNLWDMGIS